MKRESVSSSDLASVGYEKNDQILEIEFNNGGVYQYDCVPLDVYENLISAGSLGQYFHQNIKNIYSCTKVH